jgi:hypothetical protein
MKGFGSLLIVVLMIFGLAGEANAQPRPPTRPSSSVVAQQQSPKAPVGKVSTEVLVIHANNSGRVDPELRAVMQNLRFMKFSGFTLLNKVPTQLGVGQESSLSVTGGRKLKVSLIARDETQAKVRVRLFSGERKVLDTTVSIHRNRSFMLMGPKHEDGVLILALSVRY